MVLIGGDGRFYTPEVIKIIVRMCVANNVDEVHIPIKGLIPTPGISGYIRNFNYNGAGCCIGAFNLTASHKPGGPNKDFGIKFNIATGGPAPEDFTGRTFDISKTINEYHIANDFTNEINLSVENTVRYDDVDRPNKP
jgi:phosphoglucomutase